MEILIDGQPIDFKFENEKTLADVYRALESWLAGEGGEITEFVVDGRPVGAAGADLEAGIESAASVAVRTRSERESAHHELTVIAEYFSLLERALTENSGAAAAILAEYPYIRQGLRRRLKDIFPADGEEPSGMDGILTRLAEEKSAPNSGESGRLAEFSRAVVLVARDRIQEIAAPQREAAALARMVTAAKPVLENVPVLLQTGRDREAMQSILGYTELALKATRLLSRHRAASRETNDFCRELNGVLKELTGAFGTGDSVLIGDILEYELAPRTERLAELLRTIPAGENAP